MVKVITYGTYDLLHYGHIRLLERAKALGDYLIVGVTADDFDKTRGKINVQQSLIERVEAVRKTGLADQIIIEEYEGQKIDDIKKYDVDIFTVGSDWVGQFDYLNEYCKVVYLERTQGVSSTELRDKKRSVNLGIVGDSLFLNKVATECDFVNGIHVHGVCTESLEILNDKIRQLPVITEEYSELLEHVDAVYLRSKPEKHYEQAKEALERGKHVLCESPVTLDGRQTEELLKLAEKKNLVFMEALKTAYATAYARLLLLAKGGRIGEIVSVDATCTSLNHIDFQDEKQIKQNWNCIYEWGPTAVLPVFQLLGADYKEKHVTSRFSDPEEKFDNFTKMDFLYPHAVASIKVGYGVKSEGELIVSGTKGYIYVPAPWWKTDYFEIRYENPANNKRYFYQLDGEGIRYELVAFARAIDSGVKTTQIDEPVSRSISDIMGEFTRKEKINIITGGHNN